MSASKRRKTSAPENGPLTSSLVFKTEDDIRTGMAHILESDTRLAEFVQSHDYPMHLVQDHNVTCFEALLKSIIYQQLHGKAAAAIHARVKELCKEPLTPCSVLTAPPDQLRSCGLSERKMQYIVSLATKFHECEWDDELIRGAVYEELLQLLTQVKGIGPWTVDMLCIFNLGHSDVLPVGDLGVKKGMQALYGLKTPPTPEVMRDVAQKWSPYRSLGSYYMWRVSEAQGPSPRTPGSSRKSSKKETATEIVSASDMTAATASQIAIPSSETLSQAAINPSTSTSGRRTRRANRSSTAAAAASPVRTLFAGLK